MAESTFVSHEASVRLVAFAIILALLVVWERRALIPGARISPDPHCECEPQFWISCSAWDWLWGCYPAPGRTSLRSSVGLPDAPAAPERVRLPWLLFDAVL